MTVGDEISEQLPKPERKIAEILKRRWAEVSEVCPDADGKFCKITGRECGFSTCVKLAEKERKGGDCHGGR